MNTASIRPPSSDPVTGGGRRPVVLAVLALLVALVSACGAGVPATTGTGASGGGLPVSAVAAQRPTTAGLARSVPVSMGIPKIGVSSSLVPLGLAADGTLQVPPVSTPEQAGWYDQGPTPGEVGPAVLVGHVDGDKQLGVFYRLHELAKGDRIQVTRRDGRTLTFTVTEVDLVAKTVFPADAVYGNTSDAELRVITCGGSFDQAAHSYRDNVIVYATLTSWG